MILGPFLGKSTSVYASQIFAPEQVHVILLKETVQSKFGLAERN